MLPEGGWKDREGGGRDITELDVFEITASRAPMNNDTRVLATKGADAEAARRRRTATSPPRPKGLTEDQTKLRSVSD